MDSPSTPPPCASRSSQEAQQQPLEAGVLQEQPLNLLTEQLHSWSISRQAEQQQQQHDGRKRGQTTATPASQARCDDARPGV